MKHHTDITGSPLKFVLLAFFVVFYCYHAAETHAQEDDTLLTPKTQVTQDDDFDWDAHREEENRMFDEWVDKITDDPAPTPEGEEPPKTTGTIEIVIVPHEHTPPGDASQVVEILTKRCIPQRSVMAIRVLDNRTLEFTTHKGKVWINELRGSLFGPLTRPLIIDRVGSSFCNNDSVGILENEYPSSFPYSANLGVFTRVHEIHD